ncbi:hypothetical protein CU633_16890 [Bacillus sp. V3-13]|uniref:hypothetical protein n=1 Tax=Bacillus sp. V3-13 TaxID=2053728 RepID=UPI000C775986|nr:hypothetical protein [Bacillus sp. V3-13]PLR76208.1 hypothetical protein CU633_16890 [Bacillus sp. V3-13]
MSNGKYSMKVNQGAQTMELMVGGTFTPADVDSFIKDYQRNVASIDAKSFSLELDCTTMNLVTPEMVPLLESCYKLYKESGFKQVIFKIKQSTILKMQLSRLARNTGLQNAQVVEI